MEFFYCLIKAIVFYENQKAIAILELCFECRKYLQYPSKTRFQCIDMSKMNDFFRKSGIKKGFIDYDKDGNLIKE